MKAEDKHRWKFSRKIEPLTYVLPLNLSNRPNECSMPYFHQTRLALISISMHIIFVPNYKFQLHFKRNAMEPNIFNLYHVKVTCITIFLRC